VALNPLSWYTTGALFAFARPIERLLTARGPLTHPLQRTHSQARIRRLVNG